MSQIGSDLYLQQWPIGTTVGAYNGYFDWPLIRSEPVEVRPAVGVAQSNRQQWVNTTGGAGVSAFLQGYSKAPPGNYLTWRLMDSHATLALVKFVVVSPIIAGSRDYAVRTPDGKKRPRDKGTTSNGVSRDKYDDMVDFARRVLDPLMGRLVYDSCRALSFGHYPFEVVWAPKRMGGDMRHVITEFAGLLPETTQIMVYDFTREFAGLRNQGYGSAFKDFNPINCFNFVYDPEAGSFYGRSRHENCRQEWWEKLQAQVASQHLDQMASSNQPMVTGPPATDQQQTVNGVTSWVPGAKAAENIMAGLRNGQGVYWNNFLFDFDANLLSNPEYCKCITALAQVGQFSVKPYDSGNRAPHANQILSKFNYLDKQMFRGWHCPERVAMEGEHGTLAEAEAHANVSTLDSEWVHQMICEQISLGPLNNLLVQNFGEEARDAVYIVPDPLVDADTAFIRAVTLAILADRNTGPALQAWIDKPSLLKKGDLPLLEHPEPIVVPTDGTGAINGPGAAVGVQKPVGKVAAGNIDPKGVNGGNGVAMSRRQRAENRMRWLLDDEAE